MIVRMVWSFVFQVINAMAVSSQIYGRLKPLVAYSELRVSSLVRRYKSHRYVAVYCKATNRIQECVYTLGLLRQMLHDGLRINFHFRVAAASAAARPAKLFQTGN